MGFIDNLENELNKRNIKIKDLCVNANIPRTTYQQWLKGSQPTADKIERISNYLNISTDILIKGYTDNNTEIVDIYNKLDTTDKTIVDTIFNKYKNTMGKLSNSKIG